MTDTLKRYRKDLIHRLKGCLYDPASTDKERRFNHALCEALDALKHADTQDNSDKSATVDEGSIGYKEQSSGVARLSRCHKAFEKRYFSSPLTEKEWQITFDGKGPHDFYQFEAGYLAAQPSEIPVLERKYIYMGVEFNESQWSIVGDLLNTPKWKFSWAEAAQMASSDADSIDKNEPPIKTGTALRLLALKFMEKHIRCRQTRGHYGDS